MVMKKYSPQQTTTKIWLSTLRKLRLLRARTGLSMVAILDQLVTTELAAVSEGENGLTQQPDPASSPGQPSQLVGETQNLKEKEK